MLLKYEDGTKVCEKANTQDVRNEIQRNETSNVN